MVYSNKNRNNIIMVSSTDICLFLLGHGFSSQAYQNLEFEMEHVINSIKPDLLRSLEPSKQSTKVNSIIDSKSIFDLEQNISKFVMECRKRHRRNILPAIQEVQSS